MIMQKVTKQMAVKHRNARSRIIWHLSLAAIGFLSTRSSNAEGFRNPTIGTFDLGRSGGRIAQVDDSTAVQQNPANLVDLTNSDIQITPSVVYIKADFSSATAPGQTSSTTDPWKLLPNLFCAVPLKEDKIAVGLGLTTPYGLASEWNQNSSAFASHTGVLRYQSPYFAQLETININPALSVRLFDKFSIGAGFDAMWSKLKLEENYPWLAFPGSTGTEPDGRAKGSGDGFGYGGNIGVTWQITDRQRFAATYRSPMNVYYNGSFNINNLTPTAAFLGATPTSSFSSKIRFPSIVSVGYGIQISDSFRLESDVEWIQFSRFKSLNINAGNNTFLFGTAANAPENWKDTFTAGIGGDWKFADHWVLRSGYQFFQSPVPDSTFSPTIPDSDQNVITVGIGWKGRHNSLEAAYGLDFYNDRNITTDQNAAFNGKYTFTVHLFSLAYHYSF
jgi:long-chain fatty acid transport protein